jgi:hypothetical protein
MDKNHIEDLIDKKVAEAKLEVSEKRLNFHMWMAGAALALFGVVFPLLLSNRSADKVDSALIQMRLENVKTSEGIRTDSRASADSLEKAIPAIRSDLRAELDGQSRQLGSTATKVDNAISDMNKQFKELAGTQLRKPLLDCLLKGSNLEGEDLNFSPEHKQITIQIKNVGDAPARNIRVRLYTNIADNNAIQGEETQWDQLSLSDEPGYKYAFQSFAPQPIDPKESRTIDLVILNEYVKSGSYPSLLKVYYEQPEPRKYSFTINIRGNK